MGMTACDYDVDTDAVDSATNLTDDATAWDSGPIRTGTYAAAEADAGEMWDLTSATCDDGLGWCLHYRSLYLERCAIMLNTDPG